MSIAFGSPEAAALVSKDRKAKLEGQLRSLKRRRVESLAEIDAEIARIEHQLSLLGTAPDSAQNGLFAGDAQ